MNKFIKIGILLSLFLFFGFFFGCEKEHINRNLYSLSSVYLESSQNRDWNDWNISIGIIANFDKTIQLSMMRNNTSMLFAATNPTVLPNAFNSNNKIKSFSLKVIPQDLQLTDLLLTKDEKNIEDFIKEVNTDFGNNYGDTIRQHKTFYLKNFPVSLNDKDFRIVFSVITEEGQNFADTTAMIHLK